MQLLEIRPRGALLAFCVLAMAALAASETADDAPQNKAPAATCGAPLASNMTGELLSHTTYAQCEYPANLTCEWNIEAIKSNPLSRIEFSFLSYEMPNEQPNCKDSFLNFYDKKTDKLDKSLCNGRKVPTPFASSGNQVRVLFQSTRDLQGMTAKGFHMKWRVTRECQAGDFKCKNGDCIPEHFHCDGGTGLPLEDCEDKSDEDDCTARILKQCPKGGELLCNNKLRCFNKLRQCDGAADCRDGTDEINCPDRDCKENPGELPCNHKKTCYNVQEQECDGKQDCRDNTDEANCVVQNCTDQQFRCANKFMCIPKLKECDGVTDCKDNSDENHCIKPTCTPNELSCDKGYRCYNKKNQCDGKQHCSDGEDESPKHCKVLDKCPKTDQVLCGHKFACVEKKKICDSKEDCSDGSDEKLCKSEGFSCPPTQFPCRTAQCVNVSQRCDMRPDCFDGLDEDDCLYTTEAGPPCALNHVWCRGAKKCIRASLACNGVKDCGGTDNSDEENCAASPEEACTTSWHRCDNRQYIKLTKRCDNHKNCADGSDEKSCTTSG